MALPTMDAREPFNPNDLADVILQSSDNVHFYIHSAFLSFVSPTFRDMFSLNRGPAVNENEKKGMLPITSVTEDSETLYFLLERIYPIDESPFHDLGAFRKACKAAQKYLMDSIENMLRRWILASQLLKDEPFRVFAIAIDLRWEAVALTAARGTLQVALEQLPFVDELKDISGSDFYRFLDYRFRCSELSDTSKEELMTLTRVVTDPPQSDVSARAPEPFDSRDNGNVILRSSDSVDFFVIEGMIRLVSQIFEDMFPLGEHNEIDGCPIINLPEDSRVLHGLLSLIYPYVDEPVMDDYHLFKRILQAARKYDISVIEKKLGKLAMTSLVDKEPLRMYAVSTCLGWNGVAKKAALNTLSEPLKNMKFVEEMDQITGADLYSLMRYRFTCAEEACKTANDSSVHKEHEYRNLASSTYCNCNRRRRGWDGHGINCNKSKRSSEVNKLLKDCPRGTTYKSIYTMEYERLAGITGATQHRPEFSKAKAIENYRDGLVAAIEEAVLKVSLGSSDARQPEPVDPSRRGSYFSKRQSKKVRACQSSDQ